MEPKIKLSLPARISSLRRRLDGILDRVWSFFVLSFSVVKAKFKKLTNFITAKDDTGNRETGSPKQVPVAVETVSPKPSNQNTNESEKRGPSSWWRLVEVIGAVAVIISAGIFYCQLQAQLKAMRIDQRAWCGFGTIRSFTLEAGKPFFIRVPFQNTGKTPAIDESAGMWIGIANLSDRPDVERLDELVKKYMGPEAALLLPGEIEELHPNIHDRPSGVISQEFLEEIKPPKAILIAGKIVYKDIFGFQHVTRYCYRSIPDFVDGIVFKPCPFYNSIDTNQE